MVTISIIYVFASQGGDTVWRQAFTYVVEFPGWPILFLLRALLGGTEGQLSGQVLSVASTNISFVLIYFVALRYCMVRSDDNKAQHTWADSVYYLGFILTLTALIVALTQIRGSEEEEIIKGIIVQNAIALSSTVIALVCRTAWKQAIFEPDDELDYVERLNRAYSELERRISSFGEAVESTSSDLGVQIEELGREISTTSDKLRNIDIQPDAVAAAFVEVVERSLDGIAPSMSKLREELLEATQDIERSVASFVRNTSEIDAGEILRSNVSAAILSMSDLFRSEFREIVDEVASSTKIFVNEMNDGSMSLKQSILDLSSSIEQINVGEALIETLTSALSDIPNAMDEGIQAALIGLNNAIEETAENLQKNSTAMGNSANDFMRKIESFSPREHFQENTRAVVEEYVEGLRTGLASSHDLFSRLVQQQSELSSALSGSKVEFEGASEGLRGVVDHLDNTNRNFAAAGTKLEEAASQIGELERLFDSSSLLQIEMRSLSRAIELLVERIDEKRKPRWYNFLGS
mmetsp:Transcript_29215/g.56531  ORF Transcript_29215/g.56531 Transcript_29215/m.56531 type:complete len:522 (+) Transcript_29215:1058-2623(+)